MQTVDIPFMQGTVLVKLSVTVEQGKVATEGILRMLKVQPRHAKLAAFVTPQEMDTWLRAQPLAKSRTQPLLKHLQEHFLAIVSTSLPVLAHEAQNAAAPKPPVTELAYPLDGVDYFRKEAAKGSHRLRPEQIDYSANNGWVDLFVKPEASMWGETVEDFLHQRVEISPTNFREQLLTDFRFAYKEVYTGPEMVERGLPMPRGFERTMCDEHRAVIAKSDESNTGRIVTVPKHPRIYTWEHAVMIGKTNAEDVELPGSPYNRKLPSWRGL